MRFFGIRRDQLVLIALIFLSVTLLTLHSREGESGVLHRVQDFSREAVAPLSSAVTGVFAPLRHGWEYIISIGRLQKENKELREELADIKEKLIKLRVAEEENKQLKALLQLKEELPDKTSTARVINRIFSGGQAAIVLNKGTSDGIFKGMPVLVKEGLVGQVISASPNASLVQLLIDPKSGVGVQILRTGENGILEGQINLDLKIQLISSGSKVKKGDVIITSGLGGVYPKGIYVGKVVEAKVRPNSLFKDVKVKSKVDFLKVELVLVITNPVKVPQFSFEEESVLK